LLIDLSWSSSRLEGNTKKASWKAFLLIRLMKYFDFGWTIWIMLKMAEEYNNEFSEKDIFYKGQAKPYQMRQFLKLVERHNLKLEDE